MSNQKDNQSRRRFIQLGAAIAAATTLSGCEKKKKTQKIATRKLGDKNASTLSEAIESGKKVDKAKLDKLKKVLYHDSTVKMPGVVKLNSGQP